MRNLSQVSGLPIFLTDQGRLEFGEALDPVFPSVRLLEDVRPILANSNASGPRELYYMYRQVCFPEHAGLFHRANVRYDITVLNPGRIGREAIKTAGHYHPIAQGSEVSYPEVYEVLYGVAHFLLQKTDYSRQVVEDAYVVEAYPGDKVLFPPGYGHVTINGSDEFLVMSNLVAADFPSVYGPFLRNHGAAYYEIEENGHRYWVPNQNYRRVAPLRRTNTQPCPEWGLTPDTPLYQAFLKQPERFSYLDKPQHLLQTVVDSPLSGSA